MAHFSYKAISHQGKPVDGTITADRIELASRELRSQGLTLISLEPTRSGAGNDPGGSGTGSASAEEVLALTRELSVLLRAGLPIDRALKVMIEMASNDRLRELLQSLLGSVKAGKGLSQALLAYPTVFNNFYVNMVKSGEASGRLDEVLERLADYLANARAVRSSVISALIYPSILLSVAIVSIGLMLGFVVPQFETLFEEMGDALPSLTRGVLAAGAFIENWGWLLLASLVAGGWLLRNWLRSPEGRQRFDRQLIELPVFGEVVFKYEVARFSRTLGTLLGNGVALLQAIAIAVQTVDNSRIRNALSVLEPAVKRGQRISVALDESGVFSPLMVQMARVGEESGSLDRMMTELADVYDGEVQAGVKRGLTVLEPALILSLAAVIAIIIIAILMGIMSVNNLAL